MEFTLTHPDIGTKNILVLFDGVPYEADSNHPWWHEIVDLVLDDGPRVLDLFPMRFGGPGNLIHDDGFITGETPEPVWSRDPEPSLVYDDTCNDPGCFECYGDPTFEPHWVDDLTDDELDKLVGNPKGDIADATTVGIVPCGNPKCSSCYSPVAPDEQARMEVEANLNYMPLDALATREILEVKLERAEECAENWELLFQESMNCLLEAANELLVSEENNQIASQLLDSWQNRALILESAVKTYAGHIWNDIKQKLQEPTS
jgi:hypothetical protein